MNTIHTTACEEDQDCWDCTTMGNHVCGPTVETGEPPVPPGDYPPNTAPPAERDSEPIDLSDSLPDGQCWVPADRMDEFPMLNYVPCVELLPPAPTATEAMVAQPPASLPATGGEMYVGLFGSALLLAGLTLRWAVR